MIRVNITYATKNKKIEYSDEYRLDSKLKLWLFDNLIKGELPMQVVEIIQRCYDGELRGMKSVTYVFWDGPVLTLQKSETD